MRVVLDSNVFIAAVAARALCEVIVELCLERHRLISSEEILGEVEEKLRTKLKVPHRVAAEYVRFLRQNAELVMPEKLDPTTCRDPDDLVVLGLVSPGNAHAIVTGDKDLLVLGNFKVIPIMTPRAFWEFSQAEG